MRVIVNKFSFLSTQKAEENTNKNKTNPAKSLDRNWLLTFTDKENKRKNNLNNEKKSSHKTSFCGISGNQYLRPSLDFGTNATDSQPCTSWYVKH